MNNTLAIAQIVISIILIVLILLQRRDSDMGGFLGGSSSGGAYQQRRGLERAFVWVTVILAIIFVGTAIARIFVHEEQILTTEEATPIEYQLSPTSTTSTVSQ